MTWGQQKCSAASLTAASLAEVAQIVMWTFKSIHNISRVHLIGKLG